MTDGGNIEATVRFSIVPEAVSDHTALGLSANAVRLYAVLDRFGNSEGAQAVPGRRLLAKRCGFSLDTLDRAKAELVKVGLLEVQKRTNATSVYVLHRAPAGEVAALVRLPGGRTDAARGGRTDAAQQRELSTERTPSANALGVPGRSRDLLWEALTEAMRTAAPVTKSGRGAWNRAVTELRDAGATPELIVEAAKNYRQQWPTVTLTPTALAKHWHVFAIEAEGRTVVKLAEAWARNTGAGQEPDLQEEVIDRYRKRGLTDEETEHVRRILNERRPELPIERLAERSVA